MKAQNWLINRPIWGREVDGAGRKLYRGSFTSPSILVPGKSYEVVTIWFWSKTPTATMRYIAKSKKHPSEYNNTAL